LDPCNLWCRKVFETIIEWVQLDELAHARGYVAPCVKDGRIRINKDASHLDVNLAYWAYLLLVFTGEAAFGTLGVIVALLGIIIGKMFLDRVIDRWIENYAGFNTFIDKPVPGTSLKLQAFVRDLGWPTGTFAVFANASFSKLELA
jgi:hypothetical protein